MNCSGCFLVLCILCCGEATYSCSENAVEVVRVHHDELAVLVYGDKAASIRMFEKYRKCFSVYSDLWRSGRRDIFQLTVAG